eukprot:s292_g33.t1
MEEPVRGRSAARDANKAYGPKTYSYSPTSEADSRGPEGEYEPGFLQRDKNELVPSSPVLVTDSPTEGPGVPMTSNERDTDFCWRLLDRAQLKLFMLPCISWATLTWKLMVRALQQLPMSH